jgi:hypothetical protein
MVATHPLIGRESPTQGAPNIPHQPPTQGPLNIPRHPPSQSALNNPRQPPTQGPLNIPRQARLPCISAELLYCAQHAGIAVVGAALVWISIPGVYVGLPRVVDRVGVRGCIGLGRADCAHTLHHATPHVVCVLHCLVRTPLPLPLTRTSLHSHLFLPHTCICTLTHACTLIF